MNIIYVMGIYDHFPSYFSHTIPSILNYAESTGAELIFKHLPDQKLLKKNQEKLKHLNINYSSLTPRNYWDSFTVSKMNQRCWYKFSIMEDFIESNYEKALVIDLDILISQKAENIFDKVQDDFLISECDEHLIRAYTGPLLKIAQERQDSSMIQKLNNQALLFNGGLWACSKKFMKKFIGYIIPPDRSINHFADQGLMTYKLLESNLNFHILPPKIHANPLLVNFLPQFAHFTCARHKPEISKFLNKHSELY
jgi:hypothetical protein